MLCNIKIKVKIKGKVYTTEQRKNIEEGTGKEIEGRRNWCGADRQKVGRCNGTIALNHSTRKISSDIFRPTTEPS